MNSGYWLGSIKVKGGRIGIGVELLIWFLEYNDDEVEIYGIIEWICMKEISLSMILCVGLIGIRNWGFRVFQRYGKKNLGLSLERDETPSGQYASPGDKRGSKDNLQSLVVWVCFGSHRGLFWSCNGVVIKTR